VVTADRSFTCRQLCSLLHKPVRMEEDEGARTITLYGPIGAHDDLCVIPPLRFNSVYAKLVLDFAKGTVSTWIVQGSRPEPDVIALRALKGTIHD
jgi:hypothetical protein